jgi:alpha-L-fucosidase 2
MTTASPDLRLSYGEPARAWTDALPLGNGRLGAMCFGGTDRDRFQINDDTCWSGSPASADGTPLIGPGEGPAVIDAARAALDAGDVRRAEAALHRLQHGHSQAYQPLADLWLVHPRPAGDPSDYRRALDLTTAVASHSYDTGEARVTQEAWVSAPDRALVIHRRAHPSGGAPGPARLPETRLTLDSPHPTAVATAGESAGTGGLETLVRMPSEVAPTHADLSEPVRYDDAPGAAVTAVAGARVVTDGRIVADGDGLLVSGATALTVLLATRTDYADPLTAPHGDTAALREELTASLDGLAHRAAAGGLTRIRADHEADHARLFDRVSLAVGGAPEEARAPDPPHTDERLRRHAAGAPDPGLVTLAFQYGRYLMLASSRPGTLPAHLQGLWNAEIRPPWSSNYTTNINVEMNYWPAEVANLAECHRPLLDWLSAVSPRGAAVARDLYGAGGWTLHHNSDAWGFALPAGEGDGDCCWSFWPLGAAWLCRHLWDHYDFGRDLDFLHDRGWPLARDAGTFCLDWLVELPGGALGTSPSTSPENTFIAPDGAPAAVTVSTTSDLVLIRDLLERGLDMLDALAGRGVREDAWRSRALAALSRLPQERITPGGVLAEWPHSLPDADPAHRHTSHLAGVYPLSRIDPDRTPSLAGAALRTLDDRGPESTGWSLAWRLALRARLRDADGALATLRTFLRPLDADASGEPPASASAGVYRNLFCAHPPFQIDGNFGFTAGVAEMLMQSHATEGGTTAVHLLPAVPATWREGRFGGLRARGGVTVDARWSGGVLRWARLTADADRRAVVTCGERTVTVDLTGGVPERVTP